MAEGTGRCGHACPGGVVHPAPWQERAGERFGVRRSHGCIRTSSATARWLFERVEVGTPVRVWE
ncbi:MAG: L,D-transpeptidase [Cyanobium sp.]